MLTMIDTFDDIMGAMIPQYRGYSIGTNVPYSVWQEFGTSYQSGTPHVRPGFDVAISKFDTISSGAPTAGIALSRLALEIERAIKKFAPVDTGHLQNSYRAERF